MEPSLIMTVTLMTPPGTGAIAVLEVVSGWAIVRRLFHTQSTKPLPESPSLHRSWFGTFAGDEVVLVVTAIDPVTCEIHCHGGVRVVERLIETLKQKGLETAEARPTLLEQAPTLRTASILLDQQHANFLSTPLPPREGGEKELTLDRIRSLIPVGRHLVEPWIVAIVGAPNVGKSSLMNALAGFQRSIVSPTPGTTRDLVTVRVAFDGWPVELIDTAGLRETNSEIEAEGIAKARERMTRADLVVWVLDGESEQPILPDGRADLIIVNKADCPAQYDRRSWLTVSATTGVGLEILIREIVRQLVPNPPVPGEFVPITPEQIAHVLAISENNPAFH